MFAVLLHSAHAVLLAVASVAVVVVLARSRRRRVEQLRTASARGEIVTLAEARARRTLARPALATFVGTTQTAAVVHGAGCPQRFAEGLQFGVFFLLVTIVQFGLALAAAHGQVVAVIATSVAVNGGCVALWLVTHTVGLPFGLAAAQPFGVWDTVTSLAEVVAVASALRLRPRVAFALGFARVPTGA